jgi:beta-glucosidase
MGWEIYPKGLEFFLRRTAKDYSGDLPIYITENGMAGADVLAEGMVNDTARIDYLAQHLAAVQRVAADGVPVKGYFTWSLMDNFEWSLGYEKRFGLVHVDFETLQRTPKASYHALSAALSRRA